MLRGLLVFVACQGACKSLDTDVVPVETDVSETDTAARGAVVVFVTLDTLSQVAALETGWCAHIGDLAAPYGLDVACPEGGVSPGSWTAPAHTRVLWPDQQVGDFAWRDAPTCNRPSVFRWAAEHLDGRYIWASDNQVLGPSYMPPCDDGRTPFFQGADPAFGLDYSGEAIVRILPEPETPVHAGIDAVVAAAATDENVFGFLNIFEVGGHLPPRCAISPYSPGCEKLWDFAVDQGAVDAMRDRAEVWQDRTTLPRLENAFEPFAGRDDEVRDMLWTSSLEAIAGWREERFDQRFIALLDGLEAAGRLDDTTLVLFADHGDNPGVTPTGGPLNPTHGGEPSEFTAFVPTFILPASRAAEWQTAGFIGDADNVWSTVNLSYAVLDFLELPTPDNWPAMEPPGAASAWTCGDFRSADIRASGIRIIGNVAMRCRNETCRATLFTRPTDVLNYREVDLAVIPDEFSDFPTPNPFWTACLR